MKLTYKVGKWLCVIDIKAELMLVKKEGEPMHCMIRPDADGLYRPQFPCARGTFIGRLNGECEWLSYAGMVRVPLDRVTLVRL
tara:strand:+ start:2420 stop:2668 length:249 start_codon:yes stop_codon:yes gene_type:complete